MGQNRAPRRDVTHLFIEGSNQEPETKEGTELTMPSNGIVGSVPLIDPFGFLEELSGGKVHDPVRHGVLRFLKGIRP